MDNRKIVKGPSDKHTATMTVNFLQLRGENRLTTENVGFVLLPL